MTQHLTLGAWGESYAARLYSKQGFRILARNSFNRVGKRLGEVDLIACRNNLVVFIEVKTRTSAKFGLPEAQISRLKQQRLIRTAMWFLNKFPQYKTFRPRIDVCAILLTQSASLVPERDLDKFVKYSKIITNAVELN